MKLNKIIEKTSKFIADHGRQMEIVLKTKQANNPQFTFLHMDDPLHPYYQHLIEAFKKGYKPPSPEKSSKLTQLQTLGIVMSSIAGIDTWYQYRYRYLGIERGIDT